MCVRLIQAAVVALIILTGAVNLYAQQRHALLQEQLKKYEVRFKQLMAERGMPYFEGVVTQEKLIRAMGLYNEDIFGDIRDHAAALLFYHHEKDTLYSWLIDEVAVQAHTRQYMTVDSLLTLTNTLKFALSVDNMLGLAVRAGSPPAKEVRKYRMRTPECIDRLSGIVLPPGITQGLRGKKYLLIIPCLNLSGIPYGMLKPWPGGGMLIDSVAFSFAHNFTQLFEEIEFKNYPEGKVTDFSSNGKIENALVAGSPLFRDSCTRSLEPLPGAAAELMMAGHAFHTAALTGVSAVKDTVMARLSEADLIFLATHGWSDTDDPLHKSYLAFSQPGGCGYITPLEIQRLTLRKNPVVILSACQSGLGKVHEAGIIGLARAFLKTGARSVTMSLWDVHDRETMQLMTLFIEELKKPYRFSPAEPWRQAVLRYRQTIGRDPLHWGAFQSFGVPFQLRFEVAHKP